MTAAPSDVLIIGAGFAGTALAYALHGRGIRVVLVDRFARYPDAFRAEKIEPLQAVALRRIGLFDHREPKAGPIGTITNYRAGLHECVDTIDQYGIDYGATVNSFRRALPAEVELHVGDVVSVANTANLQRVTLADGREFSARLAVISAGGSGSLLEGLGMARRYHRSLRSLNVGFDIRRLDGNDFPFTGFNYFTEQTTHGVDYVTIFRVASRMRVNVFTQWGTRNPLLKHMRGNPHEGLLRHFPDLEREIGAFEACSKVQFFLTECYRVRGVEQPGVVLIADEFQSVCPATGTGLSKIVTDVDVLADQLIPQWLATPGMGTEKIAEYYASPRKRECDMDSLMRWVSYRDQGNPRAGLNWRRVETKLRTIFAFW